MTVLNAGRLRWAVHTGCWSPCAGEWDFLLALLPPEEQQQCTRFRKPEDQRRALVSRLLARRAAAAALGLQQADVICRRTRGGKPYVANDLPSKAQGPSPNWNYSLSHEVGATFWRGVVGEPWGTSVHWGSPHRQRRPSHLPDPTQCVPSTPYSYSHSCKRATNGMQNPSLFACFCCRRLQGDYVVLAAEPVCICGCDVAAPLHLRQQPGKAASLADFFDSFTQQLTPHEWDCIRGAGSEAAQEAEFRCACAWVLGRRVGGGRGIFRGERGCKVVG